MRRFFPILKRMNEKLMLPQPLKYMIIKEIAADLEDTYNIYIQQGIGEAEAELKALEKIAADDRVINQLIEVHETPVRKMLRKLSKKMQHLIEITLWISLLIIVGVIVSGVIISSEKYSNSYFNWFTGGLIICIIGISIPKFYEIYIKRDYTVQNLHQGLPLLIFISCLVIITGILGFFVELQEFIHTMVKFGTEKLNNTVILLYRSFTVICFSFAAAVAGAVLWLILTLKILNIEEKEQAYFF